MMAYWWQTKMGIKLVNIKFIQKEEKKMGLKVNNNKREILVFGKTDK